MNKDNIVSKIKEKLKAYPDEYKKWEEAGFNLNYHFTVSVCQLTLLHYAVESSLLNVVRNLLEQEGIDVNAVDKDRYTSLHYAANANYGEHDIEIAKLLLAKWVHPFLRDSNGDTPRNLAKSLDIIELLKEAEKQLSMPLYNKIEKALQDIDDKFATNPDLGFGNLPEQIKAISPLKYNRIIRDFASELQDNILLLAASFNLVKVMRVLIDEQRVTADSEQKKVEDLLHKKNNFGYSLLHVASIYGNEEIVTLLLQEKIANVYGKDALGMTALHLAAEYGRTKTINALLNGGANIHAIDDQKRTPLHLAVQYNNTEAMTTFINKGADIHVVDKQGNTPLHLAASSNRKEQ